MHQGVVVGTTNLAANSSKVFNNPANQNSSLLIHLANGNFVAYDRACTHVGVMVNYDPQSQQIVCPAHGARYDPAQNAKVLQGPAQTPLAMITIHVNTDGTITV